MLQNTVRLKNLQRSKVMLCSFDSMGFFFFRLKIDFLIKSVFFKEGKI